MGSRLVQAMRKERLKQELSIRSLANLIGVSFSSLARLERGIGEPDGHTADRIERWLWSGQGSPPRVRRPGEEAWSAKLERRVQELEERLAVLESWKDLS